MTREFQSSILFLVPCSLFLSGLGGAKEALDAFMA
jgi:hypothetical protein